MSEIITDSSGRKLEVIEMEPIDQLDLFEACGKNSANSSWVGMALLACSVRAIDEVPVMMPANEMQVRALTKKLGRPGINAVAAFLAKQDESTVQDVVQTAKN